MILFGLKNKKKGSLKVVGWVFLSIYSTWLINALPYKTFLFLVKELILIGNRSRFIIVKK